MSTFRTQEMQDRAIAAAALENAKKALVAFVYQKYPTFVVCDANSRMIVELVERWGGPDIMPTAEAFMAMLDENGDGALSMLAQQPVEHTSEQIRQDILRLLAAHSRRDEFMLKSEEARMKSWSLDALRIRLSELKTKIRMNAEPVSVLKEVVAASRPVQGYPALPRQLFENGATVTVNAAYLKALDTFSLKRLCRIYSTEAVNQRLAEAQG